MSETPKTPLPLPAAAISEEKCNELFATEYHVLTPTETLVLPACGRDFLCKLHTSEGVRSSAFVSACNPDDSACDLQQNVEHHAKLLSVVKGRWKYFPANSVVYKGISAPTPAVFILGITREEALALGRKFGQTAIFFGDKDGSSSLLACRPEDQPLLIHPLQRASDRISALLRACGSTEIPKKASPTAGYTATFVPRKPEKSQPVPSHAEEIEESDSESQLTSRNFYDASLVKKYGQPLEFPDFEWRYNLLKTEEANELIDELNFDLTEYLVIAETCSAFGCLIEHGSDTDSMAGDITIYFLYCRCRDTLESQVTRKLRKIKKFLDPLSAKECREADWRSLIQRKPRKRDTT